MMLASLIIAALVAGAPQFGEVPRQVNQAPAKQDAPKDAKPERSSHPRIDDFLELFGIAKDARK